MWSLKPEPAVGLRRIVVSDGPAGVRGERWDERDPSASLPAPAALGASWDPALLRRIGRLLAGEARRKGVDVVLAPTLNLQRSPYGGRDFESFSEDPLLTAKLGAALIEGVQAEGVAATAKHFIANDSETERMTVDARVDERTLREVYLAPFEQAVRAGVWLVMAAYNRVNGESMTESPLLRELLCDELGFDGVVVSDWFAARTTVPTARAALDLVMPGPDGPWGEALAAAVDDGKVERATVDEKVTRVLRLAARVGALDAAASDERPGASASEVGATLREAAAAGFVLAANRDRLLPLRASAIERLAVIGELADTVARGGGSATVFTEYEISPLAGLRAALSSAAVEYAPGPSISARLPVATGPWIGSVDGGGGIEVRFLDVDGHVLATEHRREGAFHWSRSLRHDGSLAWIEVHATLCATEGGVYAVGGSGIGRYRLTVGGAVRYDDRLWLAAGSDPIEGLTHPPQFACDLALRAGERVELVLAHEVGSAAGALGDVGLAFQLNLRPPHDDDERALRRAEALAASADAAVVVVGTGSEFETEGCDRDSLALPGRQDELVQRALTANPRTVVVVTSGGPVLLPWADRAAAVLLAGFAGQEFGHSLADVLLGQREPGGRLACSWPSDEGDPRALCPVDGRLEYREGRSVGYRGMAADRPGLRYPFGHGLGYTDWVYEAITAPAGHLAGELAVTVTVRNDGPRSGREVVQLYAARPAEPTHWLVGFAAVQAAPGERVAVRLVVAERSLQHWDVDTGRWALAPGPVRLCAGGASARLPLSATTVIGTGR